MKTMRRFLAMLLALCLCGALCPPVRAAEKAPAGNAPVRAVVIFSEDAGPLEETLASLPGTEVLWSYDTLFSGAAVEAPENVLKALENTEGIAGVGRSRGHSRSLALHDSLMNTNSLPMMGIETPEYNGDGIVIAVLDDSLRTTHEVFRDCGQIQNPALSQQDIKNISSRGAAPGRWISAKLPFVYDYAGKDADVSVEGVVHGTHVSALAAGYAQNKEGEVVFSGAAPAAQLVFMKVFSDGKNSLADDAVILRAMEDAYKLGADVINLSLGTDNGFTEDDILEGVYQDIFQRLEKEGVLVFCAAGNSGTAVTQKAYGVPLPSAGYTDYGSASSPGTYRGAVSVAAADAMERQSAGGILAGGTRWAYVDSSPEAGMSAPPLESLADQELRYVAVGGVGAAEDYEGLDVAGAVALVERGKITFTEKTRCAAAAGAAACLVYNNTAGGIIPSVEDLPIPCAVISQSAGKALLALAGESGAGTLTVREDAYIERIHEEPSIYEYSAWGTTSDLRLVPTITAPGGEVISASSEDDSSYEYLSGTSMASPNAAGAAAGVLQALKERRPELTRSQRGALAMDLLESTAALLRDGEGTPISPRRQGAGLVDQAAALSAQAVVETPLAELGESGEGAFTLRFQVRNLTGAPLELSVESQVLTDNWVEENGRAYSALLPLDITDKVTVIGPETISLPASGSQEVALELQVSQEAREELGAIFTNGFFVEGYVTFSGEETTPIHGTFMGYCGDWQAAPILEPAGIREVLDCLAETEGGGDWRETLPVDLGANLVHVTDGSSGFDMENAPLLGENLWGDTPYNERYGAISTVDAQAIYSGGSMFVTEPVLLRNAAHLIMVVRDEETGEIYETDDTPWLPRAGVENGMARSTGSFVWDGSDERLRPLPEGTAVRVEFYAWLDSDEAMQAAYEANVSGGGGYGWLNGEDYGDWLEWSFPVTIDGTAPAVTVGLESAEGDAWSGAEVTELARSLPEEGGELLTITLHDEQYLAYAAVYGDGEEPLAELLFAPEEAGKTYVLRLSLAELEELPEHLCVTASDYAANTVGLDFDLRVLAEGGQPEPAVCPAAMLADVAAGAWYHEAVDYVFTEGLMEGSEGFAFRPKENISRAEFLDALYRAAGSPRSREPLPFTDVPSGAWYREAVRWAWELGIAGGFDEKTFGALAPLTRQQLAVILYRCATLGLDVPVEGDLSGFADGAEVASWAREAVRWAVGEGILSGRADGRLDPGGHASRGEAAAILMRYLEGGA